MPLSSKTRLGTYKILGLLGTGGMGEVYRAKDLRLGREVALKVLPSGVASSSERLARFEREARTVARLNHPNIVTLYSVEDEDGTRFLTMELVEGQRLADLVTPNGLPLARVLELSIPLADALAAAHQRGVIHRDLKPGNVMVTRDGRVKVLDFGLARMTGVDEEAPHETDATVTSPVSGGGQVLGTVPYMAPEQIRGEPAEAPADLFALGVILYELAAGRRPFTGATSADVSSSILRDRPEPLTRIRADLPGDLERIVIRCLEKNSRERAQSALDVSNELRRLRRDLERGTPERYPSDKTASVAVLPFMNRSADADDEYFSDGLADELLSVLAKVKGLRVPARASSFHFKGKDTPLSEIGKALNVATVLDGSIRKAGNRVRISVQLVKVSDGYHLWSESYDRNLDDIFAVQDDIARSVVSELRRELLGFSPNRDSRRGVEAEVKAAGRGRGASSEAHRLFLQGRFFVSRFNGEDVKKGITYLREAVALDETHAAAWAALAMAHMSAWGYGWGPATEEVPRAREAACRSLEIQPDLAEGHLATGTVQWAYDWNWSAAEASFRRAQELAPNDADAISGVGEVAYTLGRLDEALTLYMLSRDQDPLTAGYSAQLGRIYDAMSRPSEARAAYLKVLELAPQRITTHAFLALTSLNLGLLESAATEAAKEPDRAFGMMARSIIAHRTGRAQEAEDILADLIKVGATVAAYQIAQTYASRGEKDPAFQWLDRAFAQRDGGMTWMKPDPLLRTLHDDPRWPALLKRMRLE